MARNNDKECIAVYFGELWLRGRNRSGYIDLLRKNILRAMAGIDVRIERPHDRFIIRTVKGADNWEVCKRLSYVFGISHYDIVRESKPTIAAINKTAGLMLKEMKKEGSKSVRIYATRSYKMFKFNSVDITRNLIKLSDKIGPAPNLEGYDSELFVNVTQASAFLSYKRFNGLNGLPLESSGRGIVLISGGIDSPVAAWYAMKRGVKPVYVHVHGYSDNKEAVNSKMPAILDKLSRYSNGYKAYFIPSHYFQVSAAKSGRYEIVLLKNFMLRLAQEIAKKENAKLIFTGESLGQVASQTPENLYAGQIGIELPVLRPLIGLDKQEIIILSRRIDTYSDSIKEYRDVCSINARHPTTMASIALTKRLLKEIKIDKLVERSLAAAAIVEG